MPKLALLQRIAVGGYEKDVSYAQDEEIEHLLLSIPGCPYVDRW
jgi:hypothetical protein